MSQSKKDENFVVSRRQALKALVAASGATALSSLPQKWEQPLVQVGALPALAQTSPNQYPFSHEIESIEFVGPEGDQLQYAILPGWIIIAPQGTTVGAKATANGGSNLPPWIHSQPWLKIKRKWDIVVPPWQCAIRVKIKIRFFALPGFSDDFDVPADNTDFWGFGGSGASLSAFLYYVTKLKINKRKIEIEFCLPPLTGSGTFQFLYPFFLSFYFPLQIVLLGGGTLFPGFYLGPGCFGDEVSTSYLKV
jgi:hypothetical protein